MRVCEREEYAQHQTYGKGALRVWVFHYSDGTKERVTKREPKPKGPPNTKLDGGPLT